MAVSWRWAAKATVQRAISLLPDPDAWNHRLQGLTGRDEIDAAMVDNRIEMVAMHHAAMVRAGIADPSTGLAPAPASSSSAPAGTRRFRSCSTCSEPTRWSRSTTSTTARTSSSLRRSVPWPTR